MKKTNESNKSQIVICENCNRPVPLIYYKDHLPVCRKYCPDAKSVMIDQTRSAIKRKYKSHGRKCLKCGKDPKPNYFYCPSCQPEDPYYGY